ncbi:chaperone modulator CbpM [Litoribacter populi]|uniref:chaperone modulator CbpM n=1 Tax=Litoribacter populi TaxID=2598460 RepID=UPI00117CD49B|nr:chaperone modulator CbpM [Litoribacter populi]
MDRNRNELITLRSFCHFHEIEVSFVIQVQEEGLLELLQIEEETFIREEELSKLERMVRLYKQLRINAEGIGAIMQLLEKIEALEVENEMLKKKLSDK